MTSASQAHARLVPCLTFGTSPVVAGVLSVPARDPVTVVLGRPLKVPGDLNSEVLEERKQAFAEELRRLFEQHKTACGYDDQATLLVV